jgi:pSer/pThr/pTyr-binding forkhead associated (FHA) protein
VDLFIEIIDGPLKGSRTPLQDGLTLGRRGCDVNLDDSKVSSKHARVEQRPDGALWMIDLGSANGIRLEGKRASEVHLVPGASFRLGRTRFQVLESGAFAEPGLQTQVKNLIKKAKNGKPWRDQIIHLSERGIREAEIGRKRESELVPFSRSIRMVFKKGMQSGTDWTLGYGPREAGASSVDLPLFEPGLPPKCFRVLPKGPEVVIRITTEALGKILLNGKRIETAFLKEGDVLDIGNTRIEISFENMSET